MSEVEIHDPPRVETDEHGRRIYRPDGEVLRAFIRDRSHVSIIRGPIGSGTSSGCVMKIWALSCEQIKGPDGMRRSRWVIVRNTFPDLRNTTIKTWLDWFPEEVYGRFYWDRPYRHIIRLGDVELEVYFLALDQDEDVRKLRSLEVTGFWFNEGEFIEKSIVDESESRTGRYPAVKDGGTAWDGVLIDMNAPNEDHWVPIVMGEVPPPEDMTEEERLQYVRPPGWAYFVQPPGLLEIKDGAGQVTGYKPNPEAENTRWLKPGYYLEKIQGKRKSWVDSRVLNRITLHVEGRAVWPMFNPETHVAREVLRPIEGHDILIGLDFGRTPAAIFGQIVNGRWQVLSELMARDVGASTFAPLIRRHLESHYPGLNFQAYGDPKGQDKVQSDERTAYDVFRSFGIPVRPAPVKQNSILTRLEAVEFVLNGLTDGRPRFLLSPSCRTLKVAMAGAYHYRKIQGTGRFHDEPEKDRYSHVADALQYLTLGAGEGRAMTGRTPGERSKPIETRATRRSRRRRAA